MSASVRSFQTQQSRAGESRRCGRTSPIPSSSAASVTTTASVLDFDGDRLPIITRADLRASVVAFEALLTSAKAYRNALISLSQATTSFASALGECARVKGAREANADQLLAGSGMHYMIANSGQVLSDTLYRTFEVPLMHAFDQYVSAQLVRHREYEELLADKTAAIRQTEADNLKQGRKRNRDLAQFRKALERLQEQVREVEVCKRSYYGEVLSAETDMWTQISQKVALLLRSTLDLADRLASKANADPVVEAMLAEHPDPFDSYRPETEERRDVFSILPPLGLGGSTSMDGKGKGKDGGLVSSMSTPRASCTSQSTKKVAPSAAEVLGISTPSRKDASTTTAAGDDADEPSSPTMRSSGQSDHESAQLLSRSPSPTPSPPATSTTAAMTNARPTTPSGRSTHSARDQPSPTKSASSAASARRRREHNKGRRQLSRVTENTGSMDSMAGDWEPPVDERSIAPSGTGEFTDEDDEVEVRSHAARSSTNGSGRRIGLPRSSSADWQ